MTDDDTRGASRDHPRSQRPTTVAVRVEAGWDRTTLLLDILVHDQTRSDEPSL